MNNPFFSVTIPAYKCKYLKECLDSILAQTYTDFEVIIVNDASPYDLDRIIDGYSDSRIRYYRNDKNCGAINVVDNWNRCLDYANGEYIICMGDDDRLLPNCLEEYNKLIIKYPGIGLLHGWTEIIDEKGKVINLTTHRCEIESAISLLWHRWNSYALQFIGDFCFNTKWLRENGGFYKLPLAWGSDDISAIIGAKKNGVANTQIVVFQYRKNSQTISSTGNVNIKVEAILQQKKWYDSFLNCNVSDHNDQLYLKQLKKEFKLRFAKIVGLTIAADIRNSKCRILYWYFQRRKYSLENKTLFYALIQSLK